MTRLSPKLAITCNRCDRTSHHPEDVRQGWCANCHEFTHGTVQVWNWDDPWMPGTHPVRIDPRLGCSTIAHQYLGWCSHCPQVNATAEAIAWRYWAMNEVVPGYGGAVQFTTAVRE